MFKRTLIPACSLLAISAAFAAQAQPFGGPRGPVSFGVMDLDNDGYVSAQEFSQHRDVRMAERAAQGRLLRNAGQAPRFASWDLDGDGRLSRGEVVTGQQARFAGRGAGGRPCWRIR
jgi:hypothetical protein